MIDLINRYIPKVEILRLFPMLNIFALLVYFNVFSLGKIASLFNFLKNNEIWSVYISILNNFYTHIFLLWGVYVVSAFIRNYLSYKEIEEYSQLYELRDKAIYALASFEGLYGYVLYPGWIIYFFSNILNQSVYLHPQLIIDTTKNITSPLQSVTAVTIAANQMWALLVLLISVMTIYRNYFVEYQKYIIGSSISAEIIDNHFVHIIKDEAKISSDKIMGFSISRRIVSEKNKFYVLSWFRNGEQDRLFLGQIRFPFPKRYIIEGAFESISEAETLFTILVADRNKELSEKHSYTKMQNENY